MVEQRLESHIAKTFASYRSENQHLLTKFNLIKTYVEKIKGLNDVQRNDIVGSIFNLDFDLVPIFDSIDLNETRIKTILTSLIESLESESKLITEYMKNSANPYSLSEQTAKTLMSRYSEQHDLMEELSSIIPGILDLFDKALNMEDIIEKEEKKQSNSSNQSNNSVNTQNQNVKKEEGSKKPLFQDILQRKVKGDILSKLKNKRLFSKNEEPIELTEDMVVEEQINNNNNSNQNNQNQIKTPSSQELQSINYSLQMFSFIDKNYTKEHQYYSIKIVEDYINLLGYVENSLLNLDYMYDKYKKLNPNFYSFLVKFAKEYNLIKQKYTMLLHLYKNKTSFENYHVQTLINIYLIIADITKLLFEGKDKLFKNFNPTFLTVKILEVKFNNLKLKNSKKVLSLIDKGSYDLKQIESYPVLKSDIFYYLEHFAPKNNYLNYNREGNNDSNSLNKNYEGDNNLNGDNIGSVQRIPRDEPIHFSSIEERVEYFNNLFGLLITLVSERKPIPAKFIFEILSFMYHNHKYYDEIKKIISSNSRYSLNLLKFYENYASSGREIINLQKDINNFKNVEQILMILFEGIIKFS